MGAIRRTGMTEVGEGKKFVCKESEPLILCIYHQRGMCRFGDSCKFSHGDDDNRSPILSRKVQEKDLRAQHEKEYDEEQDGEQDEEHDEERDEDQDEEHDEEQHDEGQHEEEQHDEEQVE